MTDQNVPIIAAKNPSTVDLEAGKDYFWCRCGKSKNQPFCDGSHAGSGINPLKFTAENSGPAALCQCKSSANAPFCDGSHTRLGKLEVGEPSPAPTVKGTKRRFRHPKNLRLPGFMNWPGTVCRSLAITARWAPWVCRARICRIGMTFRSCLHRWHANRCWTMYRLPRRSLLAPGPKGR